MAKVKGIILEKKLYVLEGGQVITYPLDGNGVLVGKLPNNKIVVTAAAKNGTTETSSIPVSEEEGVALLLMDPVKEELYIAEIGILDIVVSISEEEEPTEGGATPEDPDDDKESAHITVDEERRFKNLDSKVYQILISNGTEPTALKVFEEN